MNRGAAMLRLTIPRETDLPALTDYRREVFLGDGDFDGTAGLGSASDAAEWLARLKVLSSPDAPRRGWLRTFVYLGYDGGRLCGIVNIRPTEDEAVRTAGHIGYHVRPSERRRGYGRELLMRGASLCRVHGIAAPLVCVQADNEASIRTALSAGFIPDGEERHPEYGRILRFRADF